MATDPRRFELRTYVAAPGKLDALLARFRNHTTTLFERHGMTNVGYWVVADSEDQKPDTLVYLLAHESRAAAGESWKRFATDPDWIAVKAESEPDGQRLTASFSSMFLAPTDVVELPDQPRMERALDLHTEYELKRDVEATMTTVSADPHYEFATAGWRVDGREAVREAYRRLFSDQDNRVISSVARALAVAPGKLARENSTVRISNNGPVSCQTMAVLTFDGDLISGERIYSDPYSAKVVRAALGDDFGGVPGVSKIS